MEAQGNAGSAAGIAGKRYGSGQRLVILVLQTIVGMACRQRAFRLLLEM
jgi:hypothetical protein